MMNAHTLYGHRMSVETQFFFDLLWDTHTSTLMGSFRRAVSNQIGREAPAAPLYHSDIHQRRANMVQWCDSLLVRGQANKSDELESLLSITE